MRHVLHLIKDPTNRAALDVLRSQARDPSLRLSVVLMQDAADLTDPLPGTVYRLDGGHAAAPGGSARRAIDHAALLDLIFSADSVITW